MKRLALALAATFLCPVVAIASTDNTDLKVQILPLDCLFEIINDGTNTVHYLTPAECGQLPYPSPLPTDGSGQSTSVAPVPRPNTIQDTAPTIVDNGDQVIGLPPSQAQTKQPVKPPDAARISLRSLLTAVSVLAAVALIADKIFEFGLIRIISRSVVPVRKFITLAVKRIFRI